MNGPTWPTIIGAGGVRQNDAGAGEASLPSPDMPRAHVLAALACLTVAGCGTEAPTTPAESPAVTSAWTKADTARSCLGFVGALEEVVKATPTLDDPAKKSENTRVLSDAEAAFAQALTNPPPEAADDLAIILAKIKTMRARVGDGTTFVDFDGFKASTLRVVAVCESIAD